MPAIVTALKIVAAAQHGDVAAVPLDTLTATSLRVFAGQTFKSFFQQSIIILAAICIGEACHFARRWLQEVKAAVQLGVTDLSYVDFSQQGDQAIFAGLSSAHPGVEVEAIQDLLHGDHAAGLVEHMNISAVAGADKHVGDGRAQVAQGDVELAAQMSDGVERFKTLYSFDSSYRVHEGARVMIDVAAVLEVATGAGLPEAFIEHAPQEAIKDRVIWLMLVGDDCAQVEIDDRDTGGGNGVIKTLVNQLGQVRETLLIFGQEINQPSFVDGNQARLLSRPQRFV